MLDDVKNGLDSLLPGKTTEAGATRRTAIKTALGVGYAATAMPIMAQTAIKTSTAGLAAGEGIFDMEGFSVPFYYAAPEGKKNLPVILVVQEIFSGVPTALSRVTTGRPCLPRCKYACCPPPTALSKKRAFSSRAFLTDRTKPSAPFSHPRAVAYAATALGSAASAGRRSQNLSKLNDPLTKISPALIAVASSKMTTTSN